MTEATYRLGEFRAFEGGGRRFLYLVPSAGIFELDEASGAVLDRLERGEASRAELTAIAGDDVIDELHGSRAIVAEDVIQPLQEPPADFPLQTRDEFNQPVQSILLVLLRIRRGQSGDAGG